MQDISDRKRMEEALRESEERYRGLSEAAFEAIFLSEKGVCIEQNSTAEKMFGYTSAEAIGRKGTEWIAPEDREMVTTHMLSGYEKPYEATALRKDGSTFPAQIQARMTRYRGRSVRVTALSDITERKEMEKALRESEAKFRTLVTHTEEIIYIIDKDGTFLLSEGKGLSKLGLTPGQVVGASVFELYKDRPEMLDDMRKALSGDTVSNEVEVDGNYFRNWYTPHRGDEGEVLGVLGLSVNITEQKQAEETVQAYQQRLKALASELTITEEQERRRIAADLHDDVGQSLALACMQLDAAQKSASAPKLAEQLDDLSDTLRKTLENTESLVYELSPPSLNELGLSVAIGEWLEKTGNRHGLETQVIDNISEDRSQMLDTTVRAILFRSVRELLVNVVKHARANKVSVRLEEKNASIRITVEDDGIGFDPGAETHAGRMSVGFGLFSVEELIAELGGKLKIVSEPSKGCTAILTVPAGEGVSALEQD